MPENAPNATSQMSLTSTPGIHRLPTEIIGHIFVIGCPTPNHELPVVDVRPFQHQVLVGSVCQLWRDIAHRWPALWTSAVVRYPRSRKDVAFREEMISLVLRRSGTLELDLSINLDVIPQSEIRESIHPFYDHIVPHLQRVHTLHLQCARNPFDLMSFSNVPELPKLRHFYIEGPFPSVELALPSCIKNSPLETFHCPAPCTLSIVPTSQLRRICISRPRAEQEHTRFINKCNGLRALTLLGQWSDDANISSATLTHFNLYVVTLPAAILVDMPNLLHLHLHIHILRPSGTSWPPLPSLRSLSIPTSADSQPLLAEISRVAPQLVALRINLASVSDAVKFIRARREEEPDGRVRRKRLRLLVITRNFSMGGEEPLHVRWGDLSITPILHLWDPNVEAGWRLEQSINPIVIDGVEIRRSIHANHGDKDSFSALADRITD